MQAAWGTLWRYGDPRNINGETLVRCGRGVIGLCVLASGPESPFSWHAFTRYAGRQCTAAYGETAMGAVDDLIADWVSAPCGMRAEMREFAKANERGQ